MRPRSISGVNRLPEEEKEAIYTSFIPQVLLDQFDIPGDFRDANGNRLLEIESTPGTSDFILRLMHKFDAPDPLVYSHVTDTVNRQIHVLLYIVNDPFSQRFDVDVMPDGTPTQFGIFRRNLDAEESAMNAGLAPGQVRKGLRVFKHTIPCFENFVHSLGHDLFFAEPLYYHNAVIFERYGFSYVKGRSLMERIDTGFSPGEDYEQRLNLSSPFRHPDYANSIRGRSWAIHDGILGRNFTDVTMYKSFEISAGVNTFPDATW
ncbi:MAG: hypothetical protein KAH97_01285 [Anaerolineales bacterium]|nr:hypothetical protein [Anaerolineales bacterium]